MKNKTWIYGNFILIIVTFLLLFFLLSDYTNKKWKDTAVENVHLSLSEGTYNLTMTYQAVSDTYLEAYITSNNQEYVIWGAILPAAKGAGSSSTFSFPLEYSVLNNSLGFRCPYVQGEAVQFSEIQIKTAEFPLKQAASIVLYLFTAFLLCFFVKDFRMRFYAEGIWTLSSIFLHPIFVRNLWFLLLYTIGYFIAFIIFFNKKNNTVNEDMAAFTFFYAAALLFMEIFTTSSPLFSFNKGCDENIYYAIGHGLANGLHLYTEMFDHKGPFFFFVYMIGYIISPGKYYGIYFIEVIFMTISLFCIYKIAAMFIKKEIAYMAAFSALPLLLNTNYMQTGGSFEQMAVPAMLGMLYFAFFYFSPALPSEISEKKQLVGFFLQGLLTAA
ncbi:MAG TPA: hypothetical protein PLU43_10695, partial [Lachnospiraceae bacterium]|nr:hypothetical protein [Lachnospiraceae bacterium]